MWNRIRRINGAWVVTLLYLLACCLPACYFYNDLFALFGIACLQPLIAFLFFSWWANPLFLFGLVALSNGKNKGALKFGVLATAFALSFVFRDAWSRESIIGGFFSMNPPVIIGPGFFVWVASMMGLILVGLIRMHFSPIIGQRPSPLQIVICSGLLVALYAAVCVYVHRQIKDQMYEREQGIAHINEKVRKDSEERAKISELFLESGKVMLKNGDLAGAINQFKQASMASPNSASGQEANKLSQEANKLLEKRP